MDGTSWTLWWCSQGEWQENNRAHTYYKYTACTSSYKHTRSNKMCFYLFLIQLQLDQMKRFAMCLGGVCTCVCECPFPAPLPNEWPHSGQGSSQITEQNCRQPAAWVVNKCHHNTHRDGGCRGAQREETLDRSYEERICRNWQVLEAK